MNNNQKKNELKTPGERLRFLRKREGLTQEKLAEFIHVDNTKISKLENDSMDIPNDDLINLSDIFNTTTDFILRGVTNNTETSPILSSVSNDELLQELAKRLKTC